MRSLYTISAILFCLCLSVKADTVSVDDLIIAKFIEQYNLDTSTHEIDFRANSMRTKILGDNSLKVRALTQREPIGLVTLLVELEANGRVIDRGQVRLRVAKFADVLVTKDKIKRHLALTPLDFELKRMEVTSLRERPVISFEEIRGNRSKRNLRKGVIIMLRSIEQVPDIDVGGEVSIIFDDGYCKITALGRAMHDGFAGKLIKIKSKSSGKIISARVIDSRSVLVEI